MRDNTATTKGKRQIIDGLRVVEVLNVVKMFDVFRKIVKRIIKSRRDVPHDDGRSVTLTLDRPYWMSLDVGT